jgi:hypothetical protein
MNRHFRNMEALLVRVVGMQIPIYALIVLAKERVITVRQCHHTELKHPHLPYDLDVKEIPFLGTPVEQVVLNRLTSAHIFCREYYQRMKWDHNQGCECSADLQTIEHVLWDCQQHDQHRITAKMEQWSKNRELMLNYEDGRKALLQFIKISGSFQRLEDDA